MKALYLILAAIVLASPLGATPQDPALLEQQLGSVADQEKLPLLTSLCRIYLRQNPGKALEYGAMAEAILTRQPDDKTGRTVFDLLGQAHLALGDYELALAYAQRCLALADKTRDRRGLGVAFNLIAIIRNQQGEYGRAREAATRAMELFLETGEKRALASAQNNIGISHDMQGNYEKALDYYLKSLKLKEEIGDQDMIARSLNNVGVIHHQLGNPKEALQYYSRALKIKQEMGDRAGIATQYINLGNLHEESKEIPQAQAYYRKALAIYRELENQAGIASATFNIGLLEVRSGNLRAAQNHFRHSLGLRQKMGEKESVSQTLIELGKVAHRLGNPEQAVRVLGQGLAMAEEIGALAHIQNGSLALSEAYETLQDHENALKHYKKYKSAADTLFNSESSKRISGLQTRFASEKQEQEILLLKKNNEIQQLRLHRQRIIRNLIIGFFFLFFSAVLFLVYRYRYIFTFWKKKNHIGHYRILEQIGSGGMGTIYRAADVLDATHEKTVAIKVLREEFFGDETQKKRFKQEASLIDQVIHPNIVRVIERGETEAGLYIAMEALEGPTLAQFLREGPKPPLPVAQRILSQIADALKSIHRAGIVHRDLKPENIKLVEQDGDPHFVKLLDFGLAMTQHNHRLTEAGIVMGTIFYLSPEQVAGETITTASDVHGLGVICYEMLTGVMPFAGETTVEVMKGIVADSPLDIGALRPDLPPRLAALIMRMLGKKPEQRPSSEEVFDTLRALLSGYSKT